MEKAEGLSMILIPPGFNIEGDNYDWECEVERDKIHKLIMSKNKRHFSQVSTSAYFEQRLSSDLEEHWEVVKDEVLNGTYNKSESELTRLLLLNLQQLRNIEYNFKD